MRPEVISIAGFDPSAGAGLLADIKTFESHRVYGFGVCTALTVQNENMCSEVHWVAVEKIRKQIDILFETHHIAFAKIGLIINLNILEEIILHIKKLQPGIFILWDPIIQSGSGYVFHRDIDREKLLSVCGQIGLITPNMPEMQALMNAKDAGAGAKELSAHCPVLLKGGHGQAQLTVDLLFDQMEKTEIYNGEMRSETEKHGTGCVLSSAILANLAQGENLAQSCRNAKKYTFGFIAGNAGMLGYHLKDYHLTIAN
ncbi:MAG: hydroxymethylpyrimidine/phosphomethylpyrimidine kinase [Flavobacteriales bacterium]